MKPRLTKAAARTRLVQLRRAIDEYRYQYHVRDQSTISEAALDSLKHELTELETLYPDLITPDSPSQRVAGQARPEFTKVTHRQRMFSLVDVFSPDELRAWDERWRKLRPSATPGYLADLKLDGLAMTVTYRDGQLVQAATRGDGYVGEDVTANARTIDNIPLKLRRPNDLTAKQRSALAGIVEVRGEVVMLKKDFERLNRQQIAAGQPTYANPRNVAAGSIRQLDPRITASRALTFYAWELVSDLGQPTLSEGYELLQHLGITVNPKARVCRSLADVERFYDEIAAQREHLPFWIDGIVVKVNNRRTYDDLGFIGKTPRAAVAWKFSAEQATTVVEDIVVQVGRTGALTPVAHLRPVQVAGTTVARATLHNADEIQRLGVRVGDTIVVQKAGDIIPDVVEVLLQLRPTGTRPWTMPTVCPVCRTPVHRRQGEVIAYCANALCPARQRESLYHFVSKKALDVTGLGPSTIDVLVEEGLVHEPADLFHLRAAQLTGLPLFAELKSEKLIAALQAARTVRIDRLLYGLGIRHVGEQTAIDLARHFGSIERLAAASADEIQRVPNIGTVVAQSIAHWLSQAEHRRQLRRLLKDVVVQPLAPTKDTPLSGKTVVVTGTLAGMSRTEAEEAIRRAGGKTSGSVSRKTSYVVVGADPGTKAETARRLDVPILTEAELTKLLR